jgi:hypothetical protein
MYLIDAETLELKLFQDEAHLPPYAILSHTWGDSEITLKQFQTLQGNLSVAKHQLRDSLGYWKIRKTCEQAQSDGLEWAWVDTCCIDKQSSAELSEAINSMFKWYRQAAICYAYLQDAEGSPLPMHPQDVQESSGNTTPQSSRGEEHHVHVSRAELARARWFTRGWTLQELIAPSQMKFYGKGWEFLGSKDSLTGFLAGITGIETAALQGEDLEAFSVAQRMSWASERTTTRSEDLAYSLLGIFDVNMPLLYGEGTKAFTRLQEEIMKDSNDQTLFAWTPPYAPETNPGLLSERGRSVFASHPRDFAPSTQTIPVPCQGPTESFALTNKGVKIVSPILPYDQQVRGSDWVPSFSEPGFGPLYKQPLFLVVLDCSYAQGAALHHRAAILCHRVAGTSDQLIRHNSAAVYSVTDKDLHQAQRLDVYLLKKVPSSWQSQLDVQKARQEKLPSTPKVASTTTIEVAFGSNFTRRRDGLMAASTILQQYTRRPAQPLQPLTST